MNQIDRIKKILKIILVILAFFLIYWDILQYIIIKLLFLIYIILKSIIFVENGRTKNNDLKYLLKIWICFGIYILMDYLLNILFIILPGALIYNISKLFIFFAMININTINIIYNNIVKYRFIMYKKNIIDLVNRVENTNIMNFNGRELINVIIKLF